MISWTVDDALGASFAGDVDHTAVVPILDRILVEHDTAAVVAVIVTDDTRIRALNQEYRSIDRPTDVLSFNLSDEHIPADDTLGEVYISAEMASRQAVEAGRSLQDEVAHLAIHGVLHLLGYEHDTDQGFEHMRSAEERYLDLRHPLNSREN